MCQEWEHPRLTKAEVHRGDLLSRRTSQEHSADTDRHYRNTGQEGVLKYQRGKFYHCIKCFVANFLAAFMWGRPLNSAVLATTTHRMPERVSDGTNTQVEAQIINECRIKIVQRELYNVRDPQWIGDRKNHERNTVAIKNQICNQICVKCIRTHLLGLCWWQFFSRKINLSSCSWHFIFLSNSF